MKKTLILWLTIIFSLTASTLPAADLHYTLNKNGMPELSLNGKTLFTTKMPFWAANWKYASIKTKSNENDLFHWTGQSTRNLFFTMDTRWDMSQKGHMVGQFSFNVTQTINPAIGGGFEFKIPLQKLKNSIGAKDPVLLGNKGWEWQLGNEKSLKITFTPELPSIHFEKGKKNKIRCMLFTKSVPAGKTSYTMTIEMSEGSIRKPSIRERYGKIDYSNWFKNALHPTKSFIDLSYLNHKPAGKHGFIKTSGDHFVRGDGEPIKFWGCNIQAYTLFMNNREVIKAHAKRIADLGFNLVRLHHMDSQSWVKNCLIKIGDTSQEFNQEALDTYFYWIKCLKDEGIYLWIDLHVGRMFREGDDIPGFDELVQKKQKKIPGIQVKGYCYVNDRITNLMQQFNRELVTTINPYTGLALKDEPAIMGFMLTNENDLTHHFGNALLADKNVPFHNELFKKEANKFATQIKKHSELDTTSQLSSGTSKIFHKFYTTILGEKTQNSKQQPASISTNIQKTWLPGISKIFLNDLEYQWNRDMIKHLRDLGVRQPIATSHMWGSNPLFSLPALTAGDMIDVHSYSKGEFLIKNLHGTSNAAAYIARSQIAGMPLTISEWNTVKKGNTRDMFVFPAVIGAMSAFQGWDAPMLYGYSQDNFTGKKLDEWSSHNIPNIIGMMPAVALMYRQQHVSKAKQTFVATLNRETLFMTGQRSAEPAFSTLSLMHRVTVALPKTKELPWLKSSLIPQEVTTFENLEEDFIPEEQNYVESDTGELRHDWEKGIFTINTHKTQAAIGWLQKADTISLQDVSFTINTPKAAIMVTSLDNSAIANSKKILITALGRIHTQKKQKRPTVLSEPVSAQLKVRNTGDQMTLYPLNGDGSKQKGILQNKIDKDFFIVTLPIDKNSHWFILTIRNKAQN